MPRLAVLACLFAVPVAAHGREPELKLHEFPDRGFKVFLPGKPKTDGKTLKAGGTEVRANLYTAETRDLAFLVMAVEYPETFANLDPGKLLTNFRDASKPKDAKGVTDKPITLGDTKRPGREVRYEAGRQNTRYRVFVAGRWLFQVSVTGSKDAVGSRTADLFLESFELTK